ncbi:MAG TPA: cysteine desulfurase family protein [Candidatus Paceibacterota bacterium]|nr:cysteine desulfurase family protein [Candidatus Pacearchaeota archaeon]HRZ50484.1 cysteine desulfurase family protein [Candidatus Paceibacterota bacterium]
MVKKTTKKAKNSVRRVYMDYAAATPVDPKVAKKVNAALTGVFANSMSFHSYGQAARAVLEESRAILAQMIGAQSREVFFTSSATESNNLAIKGVASANKHKGNHIIISSIEHACIMESAKWLESQGFTVTRLGVDSFGQVNPQDVANAINQSTVMVSVMHANNEIGTIQPIEEIGKICREKNVLFHTDAAQTFGKIPVNVKKMNVDLLTASSQKIYGPKGAALLYVREGVKIDPVIHGGGQESGLRAGTSNVLAIYGFALAALEARRNMARETPRLKKMRDRLQAGILKSIEGSHLNGHPQKRVPNILNVWFEFIEGESLIIQLDLRGIAASTGSACSSAKLAPSHVLIAAGMKPQEAHGSLRLSLGRFSKDSDVDYVLKALPAIIQRLREISPFKKSEETNS